MDSCQYTIGKKPVEPKGTFKMLKEKGGNDIILRIQII
jgi:hypothetical protein